MATSTQQRKVEEDAAGVKQDPAMMPSEPEAGLPALLTFSSLLEELHSKKAVLLGNGADAARIRQEVLQFIAARALAISGTSGIAIALAEGNGIVCRGTAGATAPPFGLKLDLTSGLTAICFKTGTVVRCDDSENDSRVDREACSDLGIRSLAAVPLRSPTRAGGLPILGLIEAFEKEPYAFTDRDIRELSLLAELTVEALDPQIADVAGNAQASI